MPIFSAEQRRRWKNRWDDLNESQRDALRIAAGALLLAVIGSLVWVFGRPIWQRWQQRHALEQASNFALHSDYRSAALALRRALALAPNDVSAWREASRILAEIGSPEILGAQEQLALLAPENVAFRSALISEALRLNRLDVAQTAWSDLDPQARQDVAFFRLGASLAAALGQEGELERHVEAWVRAAPDDPEARLNLASFRLWSTEEGKQAIGRAELEKLTAVPAVRVRAAVELLKEAARQRDGHHSRELMRRLGEQFYPGRRLDFDSPGLPGWSALIEALKETAVAQGANDVATIVRWLGDIGRGREALVWIDSLSSELSNDAAVADAAAQISAEVGDLDRLEARLHAGAWGIWPRDVATLAISSRLQRLRYSEANARATWNDALTACGDSFVALRALVRLAGAWQDNESLERALQVVLERHPKSFWAYPALRDIYANRTDLPKLWQLHDQWTRQLPGDDAVAATWITLGGLLNRISPDAAARAEAIYDKDPTQMANVIPFAAVRWRQGRPQDTLDLFAQLSDTDRDRPQVAIWMGLALADLGQIEAARPLLQKAWHRDLSREEQALLRAAGAKVGLTF